MKGHTMNLDLVVDTWEALKHYLHTTEINEAAEALVTVLIDAHGVAPQEAYDAFEGYPAVRKVLAHYLTHDADDVEDELEELDFEDD